MPHGLPTSLSPVGCSLAHGRSCATFYVAALGADLIPNGSREEIFLTTPQFVVVEDFTLPVAWTYRSTEIRVAQPRPISPQEAIRLLHRRNLRRPNHMALRSPRVDRESPTQGTSVDSYNATFSCGPCEDGIPGKRGNFLAFVAREDTTAKNLPRLYALLRSFAKKPAR